MACVLPLERVRIYARRAEPARRLAATTAERYGVRRRAPPRSVEEALREADVVVTDDDGARADRRARLARARARTSTPSARASRRRASSTARRWPRRASSSTRASRRSTSRATSCSPLREGALAEDVALAELGEVLSGSAPGRASRRRADRLRLARPRGRGPRRRRARAARRRERRARRGGAAVIPLDSITRARETLAGVGRAHAARAPAARRRAGRDLPQARVPAADRLVQDPRRAATRWPRRRPDALAQGVVTASAGNMAQGVAWGARERGIPCTVVVPDHAPQTKLDAIERLGGTRRAGAVRGLVARDRDLRSTPAPRATSCTRCWTTA